MIFEDLDVGIHNFTELLVANNLEGISDACSA
jgi:hypothetical protein